MELINLCNDNNINEELLSNILKKYSNNYFKIIFKSYKNINYIQKYSEKNALIYLCSNINVNEELIKLLINSGININTQDYYGKTALMYLCKNEKVNENMLRLFTNNKNLDINLQDKYKRNTALIYLCQNKNININLLKTLLSIKNINVNLKGFNGIIALSYLCQNINVNEELLKCMLEKNIMNLFDNNGYTPLLYLCKNNSIDEKMLELMLNKYHRIISAESIYQEAVPTLLCSNKNINKNMLKLLIDFNANLMTTNIFGESPLLSIYTNKYIDLNKKIELINIIKPYDKYIDYSINIINEYDVLNKEELIYELTYISNSKSANKL